jgi:enediyne biosynthesis protein E4
MSKGTNPSPAPKSSKRKLYIGAVVVALAAGAYWWVGKPANDNKPAVVFKEKTAPADALFQWMKPSETGIDFTNTISEDHQNNIITDSYLYNGGGVGILDVNKDGKQDVFFVSSQGPCKLYLNEGDFKFKDISEASGVASATGNKTGVTIVDINADGWQDIYVCRTGLRETNDRRNLLYINNKNGSFSEQAKQYGLDDPAASNHANFFDADNDGDLDCYVLNYPTDFAKVNSARVKQNPDGSQVRQSDPANFNESDHFYQNNGNGTFTETGRLVGIWNRAMGLSATVADLNGDGLKDIFVGNDYIEPDFAYLNNPAKPGTFTDAYATLFRHSSNHTMGVDIADLNNDGLDDLVALDMLAERYPRQKELMTTMLTDRVNTLAQLGYGQQQMRNVLQLNNGNGTFSDVGCIAGVFQTDWSWATLAQDFDNDGQRDLFVTNGYRRDVSNLDYLTYTADSIQRTGGITPKRFPKFEDYLDLIPTVPLQNYCFRNMGNLQFEDVSTAWGLTQLTYSNGAAYADLDNDGDMDLIVNNLDMPSSIYRNRARELGKGGQWTQIVLEGAAPNTSATGARARVQAGGQVQYAELTPTRGFLSSVEHLLHFGLGNAQVIERLEVEFPNGILVVKEQVPTNQRITITAAEGKPGKLTPVTSGQNLFKSLVLPEFVHQEDNARDFERERLLPWRVSDLGPCVAVADVNKDGLDDCYVGNGPGGAGGLFLQTAGGLRPSPQAAFTADAALEDGGCHFFDANRDGALDLVVATGGTTANNYAPRLYLNDGQGNFSKVPDVFPGSIQGSFGAITSLDVDGDGDHDLVLCGSVLPGKYPMVPRSFVVKSESVAGKPYFSDATEQWAPELAKIGMVREAVLADLDRDNQPELVLAGEWMPIQVFVQGAGKLQLATERFGLQGSHGLWRTITPADVDGDGDLDLVAGNLGLNSRYRATEAAPLRLFAKDFDSNGSIDPIMSYSENGKDYPFAMRDILLKQLPSLKKKMVRYAGYANMTVPDIFEEKNLTGAQVLECRTLASCIWINEGGKFSAPRALPNLAQVSPLHGLVAADVDSDGDLDLVGAGNERGHQAETGPIDAGNGVVLLNDGKGNFTALPRTGFWATGEVRDVKLLRGKGKGMVVVGNNGGRLQGFGW